MIEGLYDLISNPQAAVKPFSNQIFTQSPIDLY